MAPKRRRQHITIESESSEDEDERLFYFISSDNINIEVLLRYIRQYHGSDANVEPGRHPIDRNRDGYFMKPRLHLNVGMKRDLEEDSKAWKQELRSIPSKRQRQRYEESETWRRRQCIGPSSVPAAFPTLKEGQARSKVPARISSPFHTPNSNPFMRQGMLQDLPMWIGNEKKLKICAIPDTGATLNILSQSAFKMLKVGTFVTQSATPSCVEEETTLEMADGVTISTTGQVTLTCSFMDCPKIDLSVVFHVCATLADNIQLLVGKQFLETTQTLTTFAHRMIERKCQLGSMPRVMRISSATPTARSYLSILMNSTLVLACPDTGSEIDLVTETLGRKLGSQIEALTLNDPKGVQFADGRITKLLGKLVATVSIPSPKRKKIKKKTRSRASTTLLFNDGGDDSDSSADGHKGSNNLKSRHNEREPVLSQERIFYVVETLTSDVVLGQGFLYSIDAYRSHRQAFVQSDSLDFEHTLRGIFVLSEAQNRWLDFWAKYGGGAGNPPAYSTTKLARDYALNKVDQNLITKRRKIEGRIVTAKDPGTITMLEDWKRDLERDYDADYKLVRADFEDAVAAGVAQNVPADTTALKKSWPLFGKLQRGCLDAYKR